jgi:hypothetical protein
VKRLNSHRPANHDAQDRDYNTDFFNKIRQDLTSGAAAVVCFTLSTNALAQFASGNRTGLARHKRSLRSEMAALRQWIDNPVAIASVTLRVARR